MTLFCLQNKFKLTYKAQPLFHDLLRPIANVSVRVWGVRASSSAVDGGKACFTSNTSVCCAASPVEGWRERWETELIRELHEGHKNLSKAKHLAHVRGRERKFLEVLEDQASSP